MRVKVSARFVGGKFLGFRAGRKVFQASERGAALMWVSDQLRGGRHELSPRSDIRGHDVAAHRAAAGAHVVKDDGRAWRFA